MSRRPFGYILIIFIASAIDATIPKTSTGKPIIKKFQQRIDSAVNTAVGMSVDNAMDYLRGIKGTKESKKALSLLGKKKNGTYEYSIDDIGAYSKWQIIL